MKKGKQLSANSVFFALLALAVVIVLLVNVVCTALVRRYPLEIDLTSARVFALEPATIEAVQALGTPVTIQVLATEERFVNTSSYNAQANAVFGQFGKQAKNISVEYIDYVKDPSFAAKYPDLTLKHGDILVSSPERYKLIKTEELFNYTRGPSGEIVIESSRAEEAVLSAVLNVTSGSLPRVAVITGHNEADSAAFLELLRQNNFEVETVQLATQSMPEGADIALLVAPKADLSPDELQKLDAFLENGGKYGKALLYCADAEQPEAPNIETFLAEWGIRVDGGAVFETDSNRVYNMHPFYAVADYTNKDYAAMLRSDKTPMLLPVSRPLTVLYGTQGKYTTNVLLSFGESSGVRPADAGDDFNADMAERRGPIAAMVRSDYLLRGAENAADIKARSTVVVSGSAAMLEAYAVNSPAFSNAEYLINLFGDLSGRDNTTVTVTPKSMAGKALNIPQNTADTLGTVFVLVIPAITLAIGLAVWLLRRHK